MVRQIATSTQSDPSMAGMSSLAVLSGALAKKIGIVMPSGFAAPPHLWVTVVAGPGESKSRAIGGAAAPIRFLQEDLDFPSEVRAGPVSYRRSACERVIGNWLDEDLDFDGGGCAVTDASAMVRLRQARVNPDVRPQVLASDVTPTRLFDLLGEQASGLILVSPEAGFDAWLRGSSVSRQEQGAMNQIWDGETVRRQRRDRTVLLRRPALSMIVGMQPEPARDLVSNRLLRGTGYALRTIWCVPESRRGYTTAPFQAVDKSVVEQYCARVWQMVALGGVQAVERPRPIQASRGAAELYDEYFNGLQPRIRVGGNLEAIADYIERLRTNVPRIAGILHVASGIAARGELVLTTDISDETMAAAIRIADFLIPHGQIVFERLARGGSLLPSAAPPVTLAEALSHVAARGWHGPTSDLHAALQRAVPWDRRSHGWPEALNAFSAWLGRNEAMLAAQGLFVRVRHTERGSEATVRSSSGSSASSGSGMAGAAATDGPDGPDGAPTA